MGSVNIEEAAKRRPDVVEWLNNLFPDFSLPLEASCEELRARLLDGFVFFGILGRIKPDLLEKSQFREYAPENHLEYIRMFLSAADEMGLPCFKILDLEQGSMSSVVVCLLSLKDHLNSGNGNDSFQRTLAKCQSQPSNGWGCLEGDCLETKDVQQGEQTNGEANSVGLGDERNQNNQQLKSQGSMQGTVMLEPSALLSCRAGHKFHEVVQLKQGRYSDLPAAKISEMMKSNSLDSAPTQSLLSVVHGILDESIERKNGELPQRVASLLKKVVQEIERRISTQAEHIQNQKNLVKACEEKYQSRIRVLETLASGTSEETKIIMDQLQLIKIEKDKIEEGKKLGEQDVVRLMNEKEASDRKISELQLDLEATKKSYEIQCQRLEAKSNQIKGELEKNVKELEFLLAESRKKTRELEEVSELKFKSWNHKQHIFQEIMGSQLQKMQDLKASSESIKNEVIITKERWAEELYILGKSLKLLTDAAENYHTVLSENRKLFNDVQELKGNIRVYCRIRPFLSGESRKSTTIDYIGENGELLLANPTKQGKDAHRTFKFNKVFGPAATQEEVFLDIQPLVRSVLDGYNVCIFAYGQTGSGKTYTMTGPNSSVEDDWGVNYRALNDLFHISRSRKNTIMYEVGVQMIEIYNEQVRDLLANDASQKKYPKVQNKGSFDFDPWYAERLYGRLHAAGRKALLLDEKLVLDGFFLFLLNMHTLGILNTSQPNGLSVPDASMHLVNSTSDVLELMQIGLANRAVGATALNERSSRSHSVVTVHVRGADLKTGATLRGSLHLVDLAGSERVDRSEATGDRLREAQHINKSLSALGDVIFALSQKSSHVPYRNSKLTQVLQSSLGGQAKTLMFVQINPDVKSYSETFSTLKFAERVSGVELGAARSSKESKDIRDLMEQVASLKGTIARKDEEIEHLQSLKDMGNRSPNVSERRGSNSLRHSSSSPRLSRLGVGTQHSRRLSSQKGAVSSNRAASDPGNSSGQSDRHSEASSQQSIDDFMHQKWNLGLQKLSGEDIAQSFPADIELLGFGDADSDERLSDISDSGLSMGAGTEGSMNSVVELSLFPEHCKPTEATEEKMFLPSQIPTPTLQKVVQATSTRTKLKETLRSSSFKRSTTSQATSSSAKFSAKYAKRWQ